jgi:hypothetical protein
MKFLWQDCVVVTDPAALAAIMGRGEGAMDKAHVAYAPINKMCDPHGNANLLTSAADDSWKAVRKAVAVSFSVQVSGYRGGVRECWDGAGLQGWKGHWVGFVTVWKRLFGRIQTPGQLEQCAGNHYQPVVQQENQPTEERTYPWVAAVAYGQQAARTCEAPQSSCSNCTHPKSSHRKVCASVVKL